MRSTLSSLVLLVMLGGSLHCTPPSMGPRGPSGGNPPYPLSPHARVAYSSDATPGALHGNAVTAQLVKRCEAHGLIADGRLGDVAYAILNRSARSSPAADLVRSYARRAGVFEPTPVVWEARAALPNELLNPLDQMLAETTREVALTHCGGAVVENAGGVAVAVVLSGRFFSLDQPVPSQVPAGSTLQIQGKLATGYRHPRLITTAPDGSTQSTDLPNRRAVQVTPRLDAAGSYALELVADGSQGASVLAIFEVASGRAEASPLSDVGGAAAEQSPAQVQRRLAGLIAEERKKRSLAPLSLDPELAQVAQAHSQDMVDHHFVAHVSPSTGQPQDRVLRAGIRTGTLLENIGRGYSAAEIHRGLMDSPGHRANLLHPAVRSLGVGVVAEAENGSLAFVATELFARRAEVFDVADAAVVIARARAAKGVAPATQDQGLSEVAQRAAEHYAQLPARVAKQRANQLLEGATREAGAPKNVRSVGATLLLVTDPDQLANATPALEPEVARIGIGIASLPAALGHVHSIVTVLLLGLR